MASKEECNRFAAEMAQRFEDFIKWASENWPNKEFPLLPSDFSESRKEIQQILGHKLNESQEGTAGPRADDGSTQYVDMNPTPWP